MRWRLAAAALGAAGVMALTGCLFQVPAQPETLPYDQLTFTDTAVCRSTGEKWNCEKV